MGDDSSNVSNVNAISVPFAPFRESNTRAWFAQLEATFALRNVTTELTKYYHVVAVLPPHVLDEVQDVMDSSDPKPYDRIKDAVNRRFGLSEKQRLAKLLADTTLGDRKPSQLLRHMQNLVGKSHEDSNLLREMWLSRLPPDMQAVLCVSKEQLLSDLAETADKIWETYSPKVQQVTNAGTESLINSLAVTVESLAQQVQALTLAQQQRSPIRQRPRSRSRSSSARNGKISLKPSLKAPISSSSICWYHQQFQCKARYCVPPCSMSPPEQGN